MKDYKTILIAEDDLDLRESLERSFTRRGFDVKTAANVKEALEVIKNFHPRFAVIDLKIGQDSGLKLVEELSNFDKTIKIVVLTGYASITTTIEAIKLGACYYLAKPANVDDIILAFAGKTTENKKAQNKKTSLRNLEMEHIHKVLAEVDFNISKAARILGNASSNLGEKIRKEKYS